MPRRSLLHQMGIAEEASSCAWGCGAIFLLVLALWAVRSVVAAVVGGEDATFWTAIVVMLAVPAIVVIAILLNKENWRPQPGGKRVKGQPKQAANAEQQTLARSGSAEKQRRLREEAERARQRSKEQQRRIQARAARTRAWKERQARFCKDLTGTTLNSRYDWVDRIRPMLLEIDSQQKVEGLVIIALSRDNKVLDVEITSGSQTRVSFSIQRVVDRAEAAGAEKVILGHCHPANTSAAPSDQDVESAAALHFALKQAGMILADDLVVCRTSDGLMLKSTLATHRFKHMVRQY